MHLAHIHSLRGIAILLVVFGHAMWFQFDWNNSRTTLTYLNEFLSNGTILFVFVAGYLFQFLLPRYRYLRYLKTKAKNVIVPYLIVSIPAIIYAVFLGSPGEQYEVLQNTSTPLQILWYYAVGGAHVNYSLWFIPMIILFFIAAPFFSLFSRYPKAYFLLIPMYLIALGVHREPFPILSPLRAFIYFLPIYVTGMLASQFRHVLDPILKRYAVHLGAVLAAIYITQVFINDQHGIYKTEHMFDMSRGYIDWLFLQKSIMCFFLIGLFLRFPRLSVKPLDYLADISFSIFFIHVYFFFTFYVLLGHQRFEGTISLWFIRGSLCLLLCIATIWVTKKLFGKHSRLLIGS